MLDVIRRRRADRSVGFDEVQLELARNGPVPLVASMHDAEGPLRVAAVIPSFRRGSGGHATIVNLLEGVCARGHEVSVWLEDCEGRHAREGRTVTRRSFREFFGAEQIELNGDFSAWQGADVALATGWQTVARVLLLRDVASRAYLVQDHEPDFYATSAESLWAAQTYREDLYCVAASAWLAELLRERYGASSTHFDLAVDHALYRPDGELFDRFAAERRSDLVVFYARAITPRRAVPLGLMALAELHRKQPDVEIVLYGEDRPLDVPFPHRNVGVLDSARLAALYREATVGIVLSLTNPSLVALEMMACGLPCVELASESMQRTFGRDGQPTLAPADPIALCAAVQELLAHPTPRANASARGIELMAERTWERAAVQVEHALRVALGTRARPAR